MNRFCVLSRAYLAWPCSGHPHNTGGGVGDSSAFEGSRSGNDRREPSFRPQDGLVSGVLREVVPLQADGSPRCYANGARCDFRPEALA